MTTPSEENSPTLEGLPAQQEELLEAVELVASFVDEQRASNERVSNLMERLMTVTSTAVNGLAGLSDKAVGLADDIAMVKGGHAVGAMRRNAALIATLSVASSSGNSPRPSSLASPRLLLTTENPPARSIASATQTW